MEDTELSVNCFDVVDESSESKSRTRFCVHSQEMKDFWVQLLRKQIQQLSLQQTAAVERDVAKAGRRESLRLAGGEGALAGGASSLAESERSRSDLQGLLQEVEEMTLPSSGGAPPSWAAASSSWRLTSPERPLSASASWMCTKRTITSRWTCYGAALWLVECPSP